MKELVGVDGRPAFLETGIIKDVMQNHLLQIASYILLESPTSFDDIKNEKIKALESLFVGSIDDVIVGKYKSFLKEYPGFSLFTYFESFRIKNTYPCLICAF